MSPHSTITLTALHWGLPDLVLLCLHVQHYKNRIVTITLGRKKKNTQQHTHSTHTHSHPFSLHPFIVFIPLTPLISSPPFLCSISPPLIALPVSLPSNSLLFMPSTSYRSDSIFISALFSLWSPVPLCRLPSCVCALQSAHRDETAPTAETQPPIYL